VVLCGKAISIGALEKLQLATCSLGLWQDKEDRIKKDKGCIGSTSSPIEYRIPY
jgi:hypothetical protein